MSVRHNIVVVGNIRVAVLVAGESQLCSLARAPVPSSAECRQYNVTGEWRAAGRHLGSCQLDQSQGWDPDISSNHKPPSVPLDWRENLTNRQPYNKMQAEYFYVIAIL